VSARELVVLGTASQAPTRFRNHNGYFLRWDAEGILFDPGEGAQRQLLLAGVPASAITRVCITHFHGDHCLGLPGIVQRLSLDRVEHPVPVHFPASGAVYAERLLAAAAFHETADVRPCPAEPGVVVDAPPFTVVARRLDHHPDTLGWRIEEPDGRRMLPDALDAAGIRGPDIARLQREGTLGVAGRTVTLEEVSVHRRGQVFAFVMDTRRCDAAAELAEGADMLVCEATFVSGEEDLAEAYGHLTAAQAAALARDAGVRLLVLTHYSQRHPDEQAFLDDARAVFADVVAARDLLRVPVPARRAIAPNPQDGP
jgi:ribonuclease Z